MTCATLRPAESGAEILLSSEVIATLTAGLDRTRPA